MNRSSLGLFFSSVFDNINQPWHDKIKFIMDQDKSGRSALQINTVHVCPFCCTFHRKENVNKKYGPAPKAVFEELIQCCTEERYSNAIEKLTPKAHSYILGVVSEEEKFPFNRKGLYGKCKSQVTNPMNNQKGYISQERNVFSFR